MEKNSAAWVFPLAKRLVSLSYYVFLVILLAFGLMSLLKAVGTPLSPFTFQTDQLSLGQEPARYVSVPVAWELADSQTITAPGQPPIYLKPQQQRGQLQVPMFSGPGMLTMLLGFVGLITAVWTFGLLRRIFITVQTQTPFQVENARRITTMGLLFLGQTVVEVVLKFVLVLATRPYFAQIRSGYPEKLTIDMNLDATWLLGLILLALAQVYRRGIEFQLENELTV